MLLVTNVKLQRILPKTPYIIYFWKADAKSSSIFMLKMAHVTCFTCHMSQMLHVMNLTKDFMCHIFLESMCYMSHVTHVTCHKYHVYKKLYIFGKLMKNPSQLSCKKVTCNMSHILHITDTKFLRTLPKTQSVIYFCIGDTKSSLIVMNTMCYIFLEIQSRVMV